MRAQIAGERGFHRCLDALRRQSLLKHLADAFENGAGGGQEAVIEKEACVNPGLEFFAGLERQIVEVYREELAGGRQ